MLSFVTLLAARASQPICFGPICPKLGSEQSVVTTAGLVIARLINILLIVAGLLMLAYMLWGAFDWVTSEGDKAKLEKAQKKIYNAVIGIIMIIVALSIFAVVTGDILGIFRIENGGINIQLPQFF